MKVLKFNPLSADSHWIDNEEHERVLKRSKNKRVVVIMCRSCNSIVHQSNSRTGSLVSIEWFKNVKSSISDGKVFVFCNICDQEVGRADSLGSLFKVRQSNVNFSLFDLSKEKEDEPKMEEIPIGCYRGLRSKKMHELLLKLMYLKCQRYQVSLAQLRKKVHTYQVAFNNFIRIINIYKEEEENFLCKKNERSEEISEPGPSDMSLGRSSVKKKFMKNISNMNTVAKQSKAMKEYEITESTTANLLTGSNRRSAEINKLTLIREEKREHI